MIMEWTNATVKDGKKVVEWGFAMEKGGTRAQFIIIPILFLLVSLCGYLNSGVEIKEENYSYLDEGWTVTVNQDVYADTDLSELKFPLTNRGDVIVMTNSLPSEFMEHPVLRIYNTYSDMKVCLDGEEIYRYGQEDYDAGKVVGYGYHFVDLPADYTGKNIEITMRVSENGAFSFLEIPTICNGSYMMRDFISENRLALCIDIFLMMFGICLAVISGVFMIKERGMNRLVCIALFSLCIGMWSLCSYDTITIFTYNLTRKAYLGFASLYLAPVFLFAYFWDDIKKRGWKRRGIVYRVLFFVQLAFVATAFILQGLNVIHLCEVLIINHVLDALLAAFLIYMFIHDIKKRKFENPVLFAGIMILVVFMIYDIVRYNVQKYGNVMVKTHFKSTLYLGALIFVLSLIVDFCFGIAKTLYSTAASEALEKMAYTDELTGLANRRRCEDFFDELDKNEHNYVVFGFDLNNLKVVNDTFGHDEGDIFIKEFANVLDSVYGKHGLVGRIGGDEFIVMIKDAAKVEVKDLIDKMNEQIDKKNQENHKWKISVAYGVCAASEGGVKTSRYAYKVADERMYRNKFEMKECIGHE